MAAILSAGIYFMIRGIVLPWKSFF
jgi:hypothetical protein